jgi:cytochrome c biogenesis protein CcdA
MSMGLIAAIIGIALVDSLNPSLFVAQFYLLTTPRPVPRLLSYIAGILTVNYLGGVLILAGARAVIADVAASISPSLGFGLQLVLGLGLLGFGLWLKPVSTTTEAKKPFSLHPIHTYVLGVVVMFNEITTALPYFVAIERMAQAGLTPLQALLTLAIYNLIFALPLFGFIALFLWLRRGEQFTQWLERITRWVAYWTPRLAKIFSILIGLVLAANGTWYFVTGNAIF